MDPPTRRTRRRSALKVADLPDDGDTAVLGRKKRVSFSTDIAEVRKFRERLSTSDERMSEDDLRPNRSLSSMLKLIDTNQKSNETMYRPPDDDLTVNFDPETQDTIMFANQLKSSSTPQSLATKAKKPSGNGVGWLNAEGQLYESLQSALSHGERKRDLTKVSLADIEQTNRECMDMDMTEIQHRPTDVDDMHLLHTDDDVQFVSSTHTKAASSVVMDITCQPSRPTRGSSARHNRRGVAERSAHEEKRSSSGPRSRKHQTHMVDVENFFNMDISVPHSPSSRSARSNSRRTKAKRSKSHLELGSMSMDLTEISTSNISSQPPPNTGRSRNQSRILEQSSHSVTNDWTTEVGRRDVTQRSILPPPVGDMTLIRPKVTAELAVCSHEGESMSSVTVKRCPSDSSEEVLSIDQVLSRVCTGVEDDLPLAPVLTGKSTADSTSTRSLHFSAHASAGGVMEESFYPDSSNLSATVTDNLPISEDGDNSATVEEPMPSNEAADAMIDKLMKELEEAKALLALQERIKETEAQIEVEKNRWETAKKKLEKAEKSYNAVHDDVERKSRRNKELYDVLSTLGLLEKLSLWSYEPQPGNIKTTTFKFPVGVEFDVAQLRVVVTVDSLSSMLIQDYTADLCEVLTGDSMPSYRLHLIKSLLQLCCTECDSLLKTEGLPLLLQRLSSLVVKTNNLLEEVERCFIKLGWFEFLSDKILYRVANRCDWACYYIITGFTLGSYPSKRLTFSYEPHLGEVPDKMSKLCVSLNQIDVGDLYLTRCTSMIRQAIG